MRRRAQHAQPLRPTTADDTVGRAPAPAAQVTNGAASAASRPLSPTTRAPTAIVIIRLTDGWARIYVDGDLRGERPVHREELPPGTHTLRFERPGYAPVDTTVTLRAGTKVIDIRMHRAGP